MIKVLKAGFYTTIQDKGRFGFANIGVPISGAMDAYAMDLANAILNNNLNCAVLELNFSNCKFQFLETTTICISGADFSPKINDTLVKQNTRIAIHKNDVLTFGKINYGARTYIAVLGGLASEVKLKSRSMFKCITKMKKIEDGTILHFKQKMESPELSYASIKVHKNYFDEGLLNCCKGPEFNLLTALQKEQLFAEKYTISNDMNRMGYRLNESLQNNLSSIITSSALPGTVQLTPSGKLIVLMKDCQVTGGYPRILQLKESALNILAQKTVGCKIQFSL
ncbi:biotin-dependent carboxyltransferase family protein [uncultured Polaribacter sp.]|uniref:5-oxoprolinase subunit C family protein n=1 Tax=uncultured Polaribacter sp. TaxID=174711 RepID=UPI00261FD59F|nr:biotin-dependent carboxyltransferase family protein [uncultured Polaribacter sp.]